MAVRQVTLKSIKETKKSGIITKPQKLLAFVLRVILLNLNLLSDEAQVKTRQKYTSLKQFCRAFRFPREQSYSIRKLTD